MKKLNESVKTISLVVAAVILVVCAIAVYSIKTSSQINKPQEKQIVTVSGDTVYYSQGKKVGNIELKNIRITLIEKNRCKVEADVYNSSDEFLPSTNVEIKSITSSGENEIFGGIITALAPHENNAFETYVLSDIRNAEDLIITEIK